MPGKNASPARALDALHREKKLESVISQGYGYFEAKWALEENGWNIDKAVASISAQRRSSTENTHDKDSGAKSKTKTSSAGMKPLEYPISRNPLEQNDTGHAAGDDDDDAFNVSRQDSGVPFTSVPGAFDDDHDDTISTITGWESTVQSQRTKPSTVAARIEAVKEAEMDSATHEASTEVKSMLSNDGSSKESIGGFPVKRSSTGNEWRCVPKGRRCKLLLLVGLLVIIGIVVGVVVSQKNGAGESTSQPTVQPPSSTPEPTVLTTAQPPSSAPPTTTLFGEVTDPTGDADILDFTGMIVSATEDTVFVNITFSGPVDLDATIYWYGDTNDELTVSGCSDPEGCKLTWNPPRRVLNNGAGFVNRNYKSHVRKGSRHLQPYQKVDLYFTRNQMPDLEKKQIWIESNVSGDRMPDANATPPYFTLS